MQAAKFSAYAPFILLLMNFCLLGPFRAGQGPESGLDTDARSQAELGQLLALVLGGLTFLTTVAAFVLGFVGLVGGISRRAAGTIVIAVIGILLNCGLLTLWVTAIAAVLRQVHSTL